MRKTLVSHVVPFRHKRTQRKKETHLILRDIHHQLDIRQVAREWESILDEFQEGNTCRPDVGPDTVLEAG